MDILDGLDFNINIDKSAGNVGGIYAARQAFVKQFLNILLMMNIKNKK